MKNPVAIIVFETKEDAEKVAQALREMLERFKFVTRCDYYDLCAVECTYEDSKYGWTNLEGISIHKESDGWITLMPDSIKLF